MNASRVLMSGLAALSMLAAAAAAQAGTKPNAARKLALAGAQAVGGTDNCVVRPGKKGKWRLDDAGKWLRCPPRPAGPYVAGSNRFLPLISGAALAASVTSLSAFGDSQPVSP